MLADLTILLHEMSDSLRGRSYTPHAETERANADDCPAASTVFVSGIGSPGKARLVAALERTLHPAHVSVRVNQTAGQPGCSALHVHAETDLDALVEGGMQSAARHGSQSADLVVPVDWESVDHSVKRVTEALIARGLTADALGV